LQMKPKLPMLVFLGSASLALASAGVFRELQKGQYQAGALGLLPQARPSETLPDSQYAGGPYPLYPPEMESGEGKAEVEGYCSTCHSTRYITMQPPLPAAAWETEVTKMKKSFGATIPDEAVSRIAGYLQAHYTPETRKQ
jgi:mono/diheme cytochrome c family protein